MVEVNQESTKSSERRIPLHGIDQLALFGFQDEHLKLLEQAFSATLVARGSELLLRGSDEEVSQLESAIVEIIALWKNNNEITKNDIDTVIAVVKSQEGGPGDKNSTVARTSADPKARPVILFANKGPLKPRTANQHEYVRLVNDNDIVFAIGPAGTGKTYLAVALSVASLQAKQVDRIILARPAVEAGESLGFLPGDFREKVDPYLRPLYDALHDMLPADKLRRHLETGTIEIVPLAYMRGRTLNHAFVILDEAQNSTSIQMKMFLTRLGIGSKAIITGDVTQIDLMSGKDSGLVQIQGVVRGIEGIEFVYFSEKDVVRHRLVREIIRAYGEFEENTNKK